MDIVKEAYNNFIFTGGIFFVMLIILIIIIIILISINNEMYKTNVQQKKALDFFINNENSKGKFIMKHLEDINNKLDKISNKNSNNEMDKI